MYTNIPRAGWSPDDDSLKVVDIMRRTSPQQFMLTSTMISARKYMKFMMMNILLQYTNMNNLSSGEPLFLSPARRTLFSRLILLP